MRRRVELPVDPLSPRQARRFVTKRLRSLGYQELVPDAELLTSEVVSQLHPATGETSTGQTLVGRSSQNEQGRSLDGQ